MQECQGKRASGKACGFIPGRCLAPATVRGYSPEEEAYELWRESAQKLVYASWVDNPNQW